jgi:hypothetical protein
MKNLLYIIGLVAIVAVIVAIVKTNNTEVTVPASELELPIAEDLMVKEMPAVMEDDMVAEEVTEVVTEGNLPPAGIQ